MKEVHVLRKGEGKGFVIIQIVKAINAWVCSAFGSVFKGDYLAIANETSS